jgi:hypothetical protein
MSQYDLPSQTLLQQSSARAVSGEELETYGKHAADLYGNGAQPSLNEAVVETIKSAGLAPEQVRRVVEFANTHAWISEFKKEGTANKFVVFEQGPAEFNTVLQDLNDGGGGTVFDRGNLDYSHTPNVKTSSARAMSKTAAAQSEADAILAQAFAVDQQAPAIPYANAMGDVQDLRDKLAGVRDAMTSEIGALEVDLLSVTEDMYQYVKQAALEGTSLGTIVQAWHQALAPDPELVKAAFAIFTPRLCKEVHGSLDAIGASLEKTAGTRSIVNPDHPLVLSFSVYSDMVQKLEQLRSVQQQALEGIKQLTDYELSVDKHYGEVVR